MDRPVTSVLDKLWSRLTDRLEAEVWKRLFERGNLGPRKDLSWPEKKLILLCVRELNNIEVFSQEEIAILMGVDNKVVNARVASWNGAFYLPYGVGQGLNPGYFRVKNG